jgi:hypothetical protein
MTLEPLHPVQLARLRAMTPAEKWAVFCGMLRTARDVRRAAWRRMHPDWEHERIEQAIAQEFARGRT